MPYISQEDRKELDGHLEKRSPVTWGEFNYTITRQILDFLHNKTDSSYAAYNSVIGMLECIKQELYRRMIAPYEDKKIKENGDVF